LIILPLALSACARGASEISGGVTGVVRAGPTCPVETPASPCPPATWTGTVRATSADGHVVESQTDADGRYTLQLPPGTYTVVAVTPAGPPTGVPADITVVDTLVDLDLEVDTGIR
jgi:hypothetical protein